MWSFVHAEVHALQLVDAPQVVGRVDAFSPTQDQPALFRKLVITSSGISLRAIDSNV
jgi:hypothetical protein